MFARIWIHQKSLLILVDLSRENELEAYPKATEQIEFIGQLKNSDIVNANGR